MTRSISLRRSAAIAIAVLAFTMIAGCGPGPTRRVGRLPGADSETGWWATVSSATSTTPSTTGVVTIIVNVPSDVLFDFGSTDLTAPASGSLDDVARQLVDDRAEAIAVTGHTDHLGTDNDSLGADRAQAVIAYLIGAGVPSGAFEPPATAGSREPLCPELRPDGSDDPDCRALNRRVTITYTTTEPRR